MVKGYKPELTNLQQGILSFLFTNPTRSFNMIRLSKFLNVSQPAIKKAIPFLKQRNFIKLSKDSESKRYSVSLNRDDQEMINLKRAMNIKMFYESGISEFLFEAFPGATIILFGSYSFGDDVENSDIDISIIGVNEKELDLRRFEKFLERKILLHFYKSFKSIKDTHLLNNILNGIIFSGSVEL